MRATTRTPAGPSGLGGEVALTGAPIARRLYRQIAADPDAALLLDVVGVGGSGKTVLLDALASLYTEAGSAVCRDARAAVAGAVDPDMALLVDDAHLLEEPVLVGLRQAARADAGTRMVVAHRPWPRPAALAALGAELAGSRAPVVLGELDRSGVAGRAAMLLDARPPAALVDAVARQTGGLPSLVQGLLEALRDGGELERTHPGARPPAGLLEQLGYQLDRLPEPVLALALALAVGAPLDAEVLAPLLDVPAADVVELAEQARSAGLLADDGSGGAGGALRPITARAVLHRTPEVRRLAQRRRLAEVQLDRGGSVLAAATDLLGTGATGTRAAAVFSAAADEALRDGSVLAGRLLDAAVAAGAPAAGLAARGAEAAARVGDLDRALELADQVLTDSAGASEPDRSRAVSVAATALAQRGLLARSAELYRWLGAESMGAGAVVAVPALLGTGALDEARALLEHSAGTPGARPARPPTLLAGAESLMARGVYDTVAGSPTAALSQLARAAALLEPTAATVLLPDTPAALAALVAAHCGELDVAQSVLERAVAAGLGGRSSAARHRLLQGWILMSRGATVAARGLLAEVDSGVNTARRLEPRDELVAAALEVGLARRAGDLAALMPAWGRAREAIVRHPVDLFVLQPLGELIVAAARLREQSWVRPHLDEAHVLLAELGNPVLWSTSLHWAELHAALTEEQWAQAQRHASALEAAAGSGRYAAAMAVAARCWLAVLHGAVDPEAVEAAARGLHAVGLSWDGGKLAGQGAIRTTDRKAMTALLGCARGLQSSGQSSPSASDPAVPTVPGPNSPGRSRAPERPATPVASTRARPDGGRPGESGGTLSDREREVAELVLAGLTYKQVGERLFISSKTVEHHVARMRQRLGSNSRGELIAHLRMIVGS